MDEHVAHVLIVEDNDLVSSALRVLFEQTGRRVSIAATVADAIAVASADRPDLMLIDLTLPDGNGLAILETLRRENRVPRVAVALTGHDDPSIAERCAQLGCADVLLKPVPTRELLRRAEKWLA
ncbi:MAG TPA: response regulator [Gemmatimonadaceae bacterium]|jgi:two-component system KDP operon response regulator KdpE|nr:response regulator [Gemmatimonadaceae bacterium]